MIALFNWYIHAFIGKKGQSRDGASTRVVVPFDLRDKFTGLQNNLGWSATDSTMLHCMRLPCIKDLIFAG